MIDEAFLVPRQRVSVVSIGDSGEALLVRAILESLGAAPAYLVICAHGTDDGFVFGDYAPSIDTTMLVNRCLPPDALHGRVALPGSVVVSTACESGSDAFGAAFLAGKVAAYVARLPAQGDEMCLTLLL